MQKPGRVILMKWSSLGRPQHVDTTIELVSDSSHAGMKLPGASRNRSALVTAAEALRESEARLRLAVQASNIGLWDWDLITNQVYFFPRMEKSDRLRRRRTAQPLRGMAKPRASRRLGTDLRKGPGVHRESAGPVWSRVPLSPQGRLLSLDLCESRRGGRCGGQAHENAGMPSRHH